MARKISVEITGDASSLERSFRRAQTSANSFDRSVSHSARGALAGSGAFKALGRSLAFASGGFLAGAGFAALTRSIVTSASTIQEETEKTGVVFGTSAKQVQVWSKTLADAFGVSEGEALKAAGVFGNMFRSLHFGEADAATMSKRLVQLAADMASFNNASPEDTLKALQSGLAGQVRPLRQFGVFLSQDRIKQEALMAGIVKNSAHLTAAQKVQASYNIILADTSLQQGDVARNTESLSVAQSKLKAAIENTEAGIGEALLPTLTKLTNRLATWLNKAENQKKIQHDVNKGISVGGKLLQTFGNIAEGVIDPIEKVAHALDKVHDSSKRLDRFLSRGVGRIFGATARTATVTGEDVRLRGEARGAATGEDVRLRGAGALGNAFPAPTGAHVSGPLGFTARMAKLNLALAKATVTARAADDRAVLQKEAALIRERVGKVKRLKDRTALYQQLGTIEGQIASIDAQAAADRKTAADKALAARKAAAAKALEQKQKEAELAKKQAAKIKDAEAKLRGVMANVHQAFTAALDTARGQIGELFQGPVLNATDQQKKQMLGVPGPTVGGLTRDVVAQTAQAKRFQRDLMKLRRQALAGGLSKGNTNELIKELRGEGVAGIPKIEAITGAKAGDRAKFLAGFAGRERFAHRVAHMTVQARTVHISTSKVPIEVTVNLDGRVVGKVVTKHQDRDKAKTASQTRGRHGGR